MTRNFHRWEMDPFFYAAEQVQDSTDRLESAYRKWLHVKGQSNESDDLEFCRRELATALGTAKWQLDEFEKAISSFPLNAQPRQNSGESLDDASQRHKQFTDAIRSQIKQVENSLSFSNDVRDLKALPVVTLDPTEKDDLAMFLSGSGRTSGNEPVQSVRGDDSRVASSSSSCCSSSKSLNSRATTSEQFSIPSARSDFAHQSRMFRSPRRYDFTSKDDQGICHSSSELFLRAHDDMDHEICKKRVLGHQRSISLGNEFVFIKESKRPHKQADNGAMSSSIWTLFSKPAKDGFKRLKDGDDFDNSQHQMATIDIEKGICIPEETINGYVAGDTKQYRSWGEPLHASRRFSRRHIQIVSMILAVFGLIGLLSFRVAV